MTEEQERALICAALDVVDSCNGTVQTEADEFYGRDASSVAVSIDAMKRLEAALDAAKCT